MRDLSVVIVSFNTKKLTLGSIESVLKNTKGISLEIIVVDNASKDGSAEAVGGLVKKYSNIVLIKNKKNLGFGAGNNQGMKGAKGRYILLLNSDTFVSDNTLGKMVAWMDSHPKAGVVSSALKSRDGSLQGTGGYFPTLPRVLAWMTFLDDIPLFFNLFKPFHPMHSISPLGTNSDFYKKSRELDWVTGAFFLIRGKAASEVGYFDEDYFMYVEETDYCYRMKKLGWEVWYLPEFAITHYGGASSSSEFSLISEVKGIKTFYKKHMPRWQYPVLVFIIKLGALLRIVAFGILKGGKGVKTYAKILLSS